MARGIDGIATERLFDPQRFVPLRHAFGAREGANLELTGVPAGRLVPQGNWEPDTVNARVASRLAQWSEITRRQDTTEKPVNPSI